MRNQNDRSKDIFGAWNTSQGLFLVLLGVLLLVLGTLALHLEDMGLGMEAQKGCEVSSKVLCLIFQGRFKGCGKHICTKAHTFTSSSIYAGKCIPPSSFVSKMSLF